ncbi:MAG: HAD-IB family phosphatase [Ruminococcus sp.]|nr:HAD-IB family phosphatase [Ruminococcus sp.]
MDYNVTYKCDGWLMKMNVYDFDNTIYKGDSTADFYLFCFRKHLSIIKFLPSLIKATLKFYLFKRGSKTDMKQVMYRFLTKINPERDIAEFWKSHRKNIKQWYLNQQKDDDIIISASPEFLLKPICETLNIKHLIASNVDVNTGKYTGVNCHGEEKVRLFREKFDVEIDEFYSDSKSDTPLAKISKKPFLVKGNTILPWE